MPRFYAHNHNKLPRTKAFGNHVPVFLKILHYFKIAQRNLEIVCNYIEHVNSVLDE